MLKKVLFSAIVAVSVSTNAMAADFVLKLSHVVSENTPKGKAVLFFE